MCLSSDHLGFWDLCKAGWMGPSRVFLGKVLVEISSSRKKTHSTQAQAGENDSRLKGSAILGIAWSMSLKISSSPTEKFMLGS